MRAKETALDPPIASDAYRSAMAQRPRLFSEGHAAGLRHGTSGAPPRGLVLTGMGFSGLGGRLVADACLPLLGMPVTFVEDYTLPAHVDEDWHVLATSYSGRTEETLAVAEEASRRGAAVTTFSGGGPITEIGGDNVPQPPGFQSRMVLVHMWASLLGFVEGSGWIEAHVPVEVVVAALRDVERRSAPSVGDNPARALAAALHDRRPHIYSTPTLHAVGQTFRGWLNEDSKMIAVAHRVPACNHNDLTAWSGDPEGRTGASVVALSQGGDHERVRRRLDYMRSRYREWGVPWHDVDAEPVQGLSDHVVEQARMLAFLEYVAYYAALERGKDPTEVAEIERLKAHMRG